MPSEQLLSLKYARGSLQVLDQLKLPHVKEYVEVADAEAAWAVIRSMQVRGAPLIAIVAALGLAVEVETQKSEDESASKMAEFLKERMGYLRTSRPTAVNLFNAMDELEALVGAAAGAEGATAASVRGAFVTAAERMREEDVAANVALGDYGAEAILAAMEAKGQGGRGARVLTICNTGALACAGWGTALGIIRSLHAKGRLEMAYSLETRPYNQGGRLTSFELVEDGLPGTLLCDSAAAALMERVGVDACVVGADRVAANGDTANKIGTCGLSIIASHHGVPFFVAAPTTTLDPKTASGKDIPIEERPADEVKCVKMGATVHRWAPEAIAVWNPAFDVTPAAQISEVVTERGLVPRSPEGKVFDVPGFLSSVDRAAKIRKTD